MRGHPEEYRMPAATNHLHYRVDGMIEVCEYCIMDRRKHKFLHKSVEERNLKLGERIYLDLSSQKKPSYEGSKNCILMQDLDTRQKWSFFMNQNSRTADRDGCQETIEYDKQKTC